MTNKKPRITDRVVIADLAREIATRQADSYAEGWTKAGADNDLRRDIAAAMNTHGLQQAGVPGILFHIRRMMEQGQITPRSAFNGMPPADAAEVDESWYLTRKEADKIIGFLDTESEIRRRYERQAQEARQAGRYTLEETAIELETKSGWAKDRWLDLILEQVKIGALPLKNPKDYADPLPYVVPQNIIRDFYDQVSANDVNTWLAAHPEWKTTFRLSEEANEPTAIQTVPDAKIEAVKSITKQQVIAAFEGLHFDTDAKWSKALADVPKWLEPCMVMRGNKKTSALWNPVSIAVALLDKQIPIRKLDAVLIGLKDWAHEWQEKSEYFRE